MDFRLGPLAVAFRWYPAGCGCWQIRRWTYFDKSSWRHGTAQLGRLKVMW